MNPSLLALLDRPLRHNFQLGLTICEAAALEASFRTNTVSLSLPFYVAPLGSPCVCPFNGVSAGRFCVVQYVGDFLV